VSGVVVVNQPGVYLVDADGNVITGADGDTIGSAEALLVAGKDGTALRFVRVASDGTVRIDPTGTTTQPISAASLPLPAGAATETTLATRATSAIQTDGTQRTKVTDGTNNLSTPTDGDSSTSAYGLGFFGVTHADLFRWLLVEDDGRLVVAASPPTPPPGTTEFVLAVNESELDVGSGGDVSSPHDTDSSTIGSGVTLYIQTIEAGTEGDPSEGGSKVEIYWVEGAGATEHIVDRVYSVGDTLNISLPSITTARDGTVMTGNGTNTFLRVRRTRLSGTAKEVDFAIRGYTES
jgi:hypothetical protein